jgi:hypothetical protein
MSMVGNVIARYQADPDALMGAWDGKDHYWPFVRAFELERERVDKFGGIGVVTYRYDNTSSSDNMYLDLAVMVDGMAYSDSEGKKPLKFEAQYQGQKEKGTLRSPDDIEPALKNLLGAAKKYTEKVKKQLEALGGKDWDMLFEGFEELNAQYVPDRPSHEDSSMSVTFMSPLEVLFGQERGVAEIRYSGGFDYEGAFGVKEKRMRYESLADVKKVLRAAEKLWETWNRRPS